jgi:hypothetical protein
MRDTLAAATRKDLSSPWQPGPLAQKFPGKPFAKMLRAGKHDGGDCGASELWCQEKMIQDIVVMFPGGVPLDL